MTNYEILSLLVDLQLLETLVLLALLWAFYVRLRQKEFFWWWLWAWMAFGFMLATGRLSLLLGPEWTVWKGLLLLGSVLAGFFQAGALLIGAECLRREESCRKSRIATVLGIALAAAAVAFGFSVWLRAEPLQSFAARALPRQAILAVVFFYCAYVFFRRWDRSALVSSVTGTACFFYGLSQMFYGLGAGAQLFPGVFGASQAFFDLPLFLDPRVFLLDLAWEAGIGLGMVLLVLEEHRDSEAALLESEGKYRALVENSQGLICTHDMGGILTSVNPAAAHLLYYEPEEMVGRPLADFLAPISVGRVHEYMNYLHEDGEDSGLMHVLNREGEEQIWMYRCVLLQEPGSDPYVLGHAVDVTDREQAKEALRDSEARQRALLDALPDMMFVIRGDGTLMDFKASREIEPLRPPTEFLGRTLAETLPSPVAERLMESVRKALATQEVVLCEYELEAPQGSGYFEARLVASGLDEVISIVRDITGRKRAEEALRRSEAALEEAQRVAGLGSWDYDFASRTFIGSRQLYDLFGLPASGIAQPSDLMNAVHPKDRVTVQALIEASLREGLPLDMEHRVLLPDNSVRDVRVRGEVIRGPGGRPVRIIGTVLDVTEQRAVDRMKDEFVSMVSHELRTPLTSIRGSLGLLASGLLGAISEKAQRMLEIATNNTDRLVRLLSDILDIERMKAGRAELYVSECDSRDLMTEVIETMAAGAERGSIQLKVQPVSARLWVDSDRIIQVLTNLLSNAIKFSSAGGTVWLLGEKQNNEFIFRVRDQGRGIPSDKLEQIFDRFQQVDASDSRRKGGVGLGLAICRSIVVQHGGRIWAESEEGKGSTFSFTLPLNAEYSRDRGAKKAASV